MKTARLGYDGKGQRRVADVPAMHSAWAELGGVACVVEQVLHFDVELSVIVARTADGRIEPWPVAENRHVDGILDVSIVPARVDDSTADRAIGIASAIADALGYVGVLAVEMFVVGGELLVNELAPRPHNSGHWTLDASATSQFEQQIRAVCGVGLGRTTMTAPSIAMVNLLGDLWANGTPDWSVVLDEPRAKLHLYGKSPARRGARWVTSPSRRRSPPRRSNGRSNSVAVAPVDGPSGQRSRTYQRSVECRPSSMPLCSNRVVGRNEGRSIGPPVSRSSASHAFCITRA